MRLRPELNWPYVIFCILVFFLMCGAIAYFATFGPAAGKSPAVILLMRIGVDALCLGTVLFFVIQFRHDSQLELDDDGISKPTMFGMRALRWTEIREVRFVGPEIWLVGPDTRLAIHPFVYADPSAFMPEIESRLRHLLPQQPGKSEEQSASRAQEIGFCVVFVTLLALHLLFAWLQTVIDAAVKSRRKAAAAVHPARR